MPSILLRCPWSQTGGPGLAVPGGVSGHKDAQSPRVPEEGRDYLDTRDRTCALAWLHVMPGELQQVPKNNLGPFPQYCCLKAPWHSHHQQHCCCSCTSWPLQTREQSHPWLGALSQTWLCSGPMVAAHTRPPQDAMSPCHPSMGTPRLPRQFCFCPVEVQGYFFLRKRAMEGGNKIQCKH